MRGSLGWCWGVALVLGALGALGCGGTSAPTGGGKSTVPATTGEVKKGLEGWLPKGARLGKPEGHLARISCLSFSPDGEKMISSSHDSSVLLWDVATGRVLKRFEGHSGFVRGCAFFPDGERVASGDSAGQIAIWSIQGDRVQWLKGLDQSNAVYSLSVRPDAGEVLVGTAAGQLMAWNLAQPDSPAMNKAELKGTTGVKTVRAVGYRKNQPMGAGDAGFWLPSAQQHDDEGDNLKPRYASTSAIPLPGGQIALGKYGEVLLIDPGARVRAEVSLRNPHDDTGHKSWITGLAANSTGNRLLSADDSGQVRLWDIGQAPYRLRCSWKEKAGIFAVAYDSRNNRMAVAGDDTSIVLTEANECEELRRFSIPQGRVRALAVQLNALLLGDGKGQVSRWSLPGFQRLDGERVHNGEIKALVASPAGTWFSVGTDFKIFQGPGAKQLGITPNSSITLELQPDQRSLLIGDLLGDLQRLALPGGEIKSLPKLPDSVWAIALHPNGHQALLGGGFSFLARLDLPSGESVNQDWSRLMKSTESTSALIFDLQGQIFAQGGSSGTVLLRNVTDGGQLREFKGLTKEVTGLVFQGSFLWAGGLNHRLVRWNLQNSQNAEPDLNIDEGSDILRLQSTPDGQFLIAGLGDGRASVRKLPNGEQVAHLYPFADGSWATVFAEEGDKGSRFMAGYGPNPSKDNAALNLYYELPSARQEGILADKLSLGDIVLPLQFGKPSIQRDAEGLVSTRVTIFSPSGPPTVTLNGQWPLALQPLKTPAYEVNLVVDDPLAKRYTLHAEAPNRAPIDLAFDLPPDPRAGTEYKKALLIGNEAYPSLGHALGAVHDVERFAGLLKDGRSWKLVDEKSLFQRKNLKGSQLRATIQGFFQQARPYETLLFYYSGHGANQNGQGFLLGTDENPRNPDPQSRVSASELWTWIENSKAGHIAVILDACRASAFLFPENPITKAEQFPKSMVFVFSTAASRNASGTQQGGNFSSVFLDALTLNDSDWFDRGVGAVTINNAFGYAYQKSDQSPRIFGQLDRLPLYYPPVQREAETLASLSLGGQQSHRDSDLSLQEVKVAISRGTMVLGSEVEGTTNKTLLLKVSTNRTVQRFFVTLKPAGEAKAVSFNAQTEADPKTGTIQVRVRGINSLEPNTTYQGEISPCEGSGDGCVIKAGAKFPFKLPP